MELNVYQLNYVNEVTQLLNHPIYPTQMSLVAVGNRLEPNLRLSTLFLLNEY